MKTIINFANKVRSLVDGRMSNIANVEESPSTHAYAVGKQLIFNGLLCKATSAIAVGDTLAVGTNLALSDNVVEQIYSLNQGLTNSLKTSDVANDLTVTTAGKVLDARQGKILNEKIQHVRIDFKQHIIDQLGNTSDYESADGLIKHSIYIYLPNNYTSSNVECICTQAQTTSCFGLTSAAVIASNGRIYVWYNAVIQNITAKTLAENSSSDCYVDFFILMK